MSCEDCCKRCCYSTPYVTLLALSIIVVGLIGFITSSVYAIVIISTADVLSHLVVIFAPILGGVVLLTIIPVVISTVMAYCVTGYIRDELFASMVKKCIGPCCSFFSMCLSISFFFIWLLVTVALSALLTIVIQLHLSCGDLDLQSLDSTDCLPSTNYTFLNAICGQDVATLCDKGGDAGIGFGVSLIFTVFVVIGLVLTLMVQGSNYVNARENMEYRRSYQPRNNSTGDDYMMKRVR